MTALTDEKRQAIASRLKAATEEFQGALNEATDLGLIAGPAIWQEAIVNGVPKHRVTATLTEPLL